MSTVAILIIEHGYGTTVTAHASEELARKAAQVWVEEWWGNEMGDEPRPADPAEMCEAYWEKVGQRWGDCESHTIELCEVEAA